VSAHHLKGGRYLKLLTVSAKGRQMRCRDGRKEPFNGLPMKQSQSTTWPAGDTRTDDSPRTSLTI